LEKNTPKISRRHQDWPPNTKKEADFSEHFFEYHEQVCLRISSNNIQISKM